MKNTNSRYESEELQNRLTKWIIGRNHWEIKNLEAQTVTGKTRNQAAYEASKGYMFSKAKQMTDTAIRYSLNDFRLNVYLMDKFGDVLFEELKRRETQLNE